MLDLPFKLAIPPLADVCWHERVCDGYQIFVYTFDKTWSHKWQMLWACPKKTLAIEQDVKPLALNFGQDMIQIWALSKVT